MKIKSFVLALLLVFSFGAALAATQADLTGQILDRKIAAEGTPPALLLAGTCPSGCESCWEQCTTSSDCGSGHKCISTACGNRCVKE